MRRLTTSELLSIWEQSMDMSVLEKSLYLLSKVYSVNDVHAIARLSIGERDTMLLQLRERFFGARLKNIACCPKCAETVEWESTTEQFHLQTLSPELSVRSFDLQQDKFTIRFRLPDSHDVQQAITDKSYQSDPKKILANCILDAKHNGEECSPHDLPESLLMGMEQRMSDEDPQADIRLQINCPACSHTWEARFDIMSILWAEINHWGQCLLHEVSLLARSFGLVRKRHIFHEHATKTTIPRNA